MPRLRLNSIFGVTTDNPLAIGATAFNSAALAGLPVVAAPDVAVIVFDPDGLDPAGGAVAPEIAWITAHSAAATVATIARAQEGSTARAHNLGTKWAHAPTLSDFPITLTRALPTTVGQFVQIGSFQSGNGAHAMQLSIVVNDGGFSLAKQFLIVGQYAGSAAGYADVVPIMSTGPYAGNDFALEAWITGDQLQLRLRRTSGSTAGNAQVTIEQYGAAADVNFVPFTGTGTSAATGIFLGLGWHIGQSARRVFNRTFFR